MDKDADRSVAGRYRLSSWVVWTVLGALLLFGLAMLSRHNFLLFHGLAELFSVSVAWAVVMMVWNTRYASDNDALILSARPILC